jgi:hypothetical protein
VLHCGAHSSTRSLLPHYATAVLGLGLEHRLQTALGPTISLLLLDVKLVDWSNRVALLVLVDLKEGVFGLEELIL